MRTRLSAPDRPAKRPFARRTRFCRHYLVLLALLAGGVAAPAQQVRPDADPPRPPTDLRMQSTLWEAERLAQAMPAAAFQQEMKSRYITVNDRGLVHVEIVGPQGGKPITPAQLAPFGGTVEGTWKHRIDAWVPAHQLTPVARMIPDGYFMYRAAVNTYDAVAGEGPAVTNSDSYRDAGRNGTGRVIAVIDGGYNGLTAARGNGDAPQAGTYTLINYTANSFEAAADGTHGTGCVESAYDHCPGATWRIYKIDSLTDMGNAVNDAQANGVHVFTHSLSRYNTGWADNTGDACAAALDAAAGGALFFTSAGNRAQQHWQGNFNPGSGGFTNWHEWSGTDRGNTMTISNNGGGNFYLQWNTAGGTFDYDLYLYDSTLTTILASSTNGGNTFEDFGYTNTSGATQTVNIVVRRAAGAGITEFEVFFHESGGSSNFEYQTASSSNTSPSNATNDSRVLSNGAVDQSDFGSGNGTTGIIQSYSSQGPSNSGVTLPDLCGPTNTLNFTYGRFGGTSSATPNNAGAACAFWSADSQLSASAISWLLRHQADEFRDWGTAGQDNIYGWGGTQLVDYHINTLWIARSYGNMANSRSAPFYTTQAAYDAGVSGGRLLIFPGGSYPEPLDAIGTKSLLVQTVVNAANLGF